MQSVLVLLIFMLAAIYLAVRFYRNTRKNSSCKEGCGCSSIDIEKIERKMKADMKSR